MKRKPSSSASATPSVVLSAFAPDTEFELTLNGWMLLESLDNALTNGTRPKTRDLLLAMLVMTDEDAVFVAKRRGKIEELLSSASTGKKPGDVTNYTQRILEAVEAAFEPSDSGALRDGEKKSPAAPAGGSA